MIGASSNRAAYRINFNNVIFWKIEFNVCTVGPLTIRGQIPDKLHCVSFGSTIRKIFTNVTVERVTKCVNVLVGPILNILGAKVCGYSDRVPEENRAGVS